MSSEDRGLVVRVGSVEIEVPRTVGYYGGIGVAVATGMIEPPLAAFIAVVPFLKMLNRPNSTKPARIVSQTLGGAAKPVGDDSLSSIRIVNAKEASPDPVRLRVLDLAGRQLNGIWNDARALSRS